MHPSVLYLMTFWVLTPCGLACMYQSFGETYCLYLQGSKPRRTSSSSSPPWEPQISYMLCLITPAPDCQQIQLPAPSTALRITSALLCDLSFVTHRFYISKYGLKFHDENSNWLWPSSHSTLLLFLLISMRTSLQSGSPGRVSTWAQVTGQDTGLSFRGSWVWSFIRSFFSFLCSQPDAFTSPKTQLRESEVVNQILSRSGPLCRPPSNHLRWLLQPQKKNPEMMEAASTSEMSVNFYQTTRRNNPEVSHLHTRRRENLKSCRLPKVVGGQKKL
jgi:hypothetical protein